METIPEQYKEYMEELIEEIQPLVEELWIFVSELGDNAKISYSNCTMILAKKNIEYQINSDQQNSNNGISNLGVEDDYSI